MKNFELLQKDWRSFGAGASESGATQVLIAELNIEGEELWFSPPGQPERRLCPRDIMDSMGLTESLFYFYLSLANHVEFYASAPVSVISDLPVSGSVRDQFYKLKFDVEIEGSQGYLAYEDGGEEIRLVADDLDDPFHKAST